MLYGFIFKSEFGDGGKIHFMFYYKNRDWKDY